MKNRCILHGRVFIMCKLQLLNQLYHSSTVMYTFPFSDIRMHIYACTCVYVCLYFFTAGCFAWPPGTDTHPKKGLSFTNSDIQRGTCICNFESFVPIEYEIYHVKHELNTFEKNKKHKKNTFYISLTKYHLDTLYSLSEQQRYVNISVPMKPLQ